MRRSIISRIMNRFNIIQEKIMGVDFASIIPVVDLGYDNKKVHHGSSSRGRELFHAFSLLDVKESDRLLDIGCGKGGALYTLNKLPFSKVDGIEISSDLSKIAISNIKQLNMKKTSIFNTNAEATNWRKCALRELRRATHTN